MDIGESERECSERYSLIKAFCSQYKRPWTCLDIGAASGYMGIRLCEDFPDCTVVCLEQEPLNDHLVDCYIEGEGYRDPKFLAYAERQNQAQYGHLPDRMIWLHHKFTLDDLREIASCEHFDVVLGLSVIHHFEGTFAERLEVFRSLGDNLILELAWEPNACGGEQKEYEVPLDAFIIGEGKSHLVEGSTRKILLLPRMRTSISKSYVNSERKDLLLTIFSDFNVKSVAFYSKKEKTRPWERGINLATYLKYSGVWPTKSMIASQIESQRESILLDAPNDVNPWNCIIQGDKTILIDNHCHMEVVYPTEEFLDKLLESLRAC